MSDGASRFTTVAHALSLITFSSILGLVSLCLDNFLTKISQSELQIHAYQFELASPIPLPTYPTMTLVEPPDNQLPTHSPSDVRDRLRFPSSKPTLWLKTPSMESFSSTRKTRIPNSLKSLSPALKKRHSTLELSPPSDLPPTPIPPQRPLRNPARRDSGVPDIPTKPKAKKRPSTATGAPEQVVPWVVSPNNISTTNIPGTTASSSVSTRSRSSLAGTGPVEEVTPWELYPVRVTTTHRTLSTGPTEEVTPWELYPISAPKRNRSPLSTGLVEDVTPWDLSPVPILEGPGKSNEKQSRSSVSRLDLTLSCRRLQVYLFIWSRALFCYGMIYLTCCPHCSYLCVIPFTHSCHHVVLLQSSYSRSSSVSGSAFYILWSRQITIRFSTNPEA